MAQDWAGKHQTALKIHFCVRCKVEIMFRHIGLMSVQNQQALEFVVDVFIAAVETQLSISA